MIVLMYQLVLLSVAVELVAAVSSRYLKILAIPLAGLSVMMTSFTAFSYAAYSMEPFAWALLFIAAIRVFSIGRILKHRMHPRQLQKRTFASTLFFGLVTCLLIWLNANGIELSGALLLVLQYSQLTLAVVLLMSVALSLIKFRPKEMLRPEGDLPTISVCIPARNETPGLEACIQSVIDSTYPKLEILVLDDCSHDKTPYVIKSFAHEGVRFIKGLMPTDDWLPKNSAYQRLEEEARGDLLVFMGVDVSLHKDSLNALPSMLSRVDMLSVLPERTQTTKRSLLIQPLRYWWELALCRFGVLSPPVLSTFWAVNAASLGKIGGFNGLKKASSPEAVLAKKFSKMRGYAFSVDQSLGVNSDKSPKEQYATSVRTRYIQLSRSLELSLMVALIELVLVIAPLALIVMSIINAGTMPIISVVGLSVVCVTNALIYRLTLKKGWAVGLFTAPALVIADIYVILKSAYGYEYGSIVWKDRNICMPMLKPEQSLPTIDKI